MLEKVLPDSPDVLYASAMYLYPDEGTVEEGRPFLEKALSLLGSTDEDLQPQDLYQKVLIYRVLDEPDQAVKSYRDLLSRDRSKLSLRFEFAIYLYEIHRDEERVMS